MYYKFKSTKNRKSHVMIKDNNTYKTLCGYTVRGMSEDKEIMIDENEDYACSCFTCREVFKSKNPINEVSVVKDNLKPNQHKKPPVRPIKYVDLLSDCLCTYCVGCGNLERPDYVGTFFCDNFRRGLADDER